MWGEVVCLVLGVFLALEAILGTRFFAGLSPGIKVPIPVWQGRSWLLIFGVLIALMGVSGLVGHSHPGLRQFVERAFVVFDFGYELFGGIIAVLVGLVFLLARKDKTDLVGRLLGAGAVFLGVVLIGDAVWKMQR
jgi:hypothetical protein